MTLLGRPRRPIVQLVLKAYLLGYASTTAPRFASLLAFLLKNRLTPLQFLTKIFHILSAATAVNKFPAFCATLIGGSVLLQTPILKVVSVLNSSSAVEISSSSAAVERVARFLAAFISAAISFALINDAGSLRSRDVINEDHKYNGQAKGPDSDSGINPFESPTPRSGATLQTQTLPQEAFAGKTMDLSLFAAVRAVDVVFTLAWRRHAPTTRVSRFVSKSVTPFLFAVSSATIMHAWCYSPDRLPKTYNTWITKAAELDKRLLLILRHARFGNFVYGKETGMAPLLESMCRDYHFPESWGDPVQTIPVPCDLVHMGVGPSCEYHALYRFWRGWLFAAKTYAPIHAFILLRQIAKRPMGSGKLFRAIARALLEVVRSSSFLGAFISLFYYGVCLSRTRLGPRLFSRKTISPQMWDSGLCILAGCILCGLSILAEKSRRRVEVTLFVLPRALACWFPRVYLKEHRWKEHMTFSLSTAVIFAAVQEDSMLVRGVLGRILHSVLGA